MGSWGLQHFRPVLAAVAMPCWDGSISWQSRLINQFSDLHHPIRPSNAKWKQNLLCRDLSCRWQGGHHKAFENFTFFAILSISASQVVKCTRAKYLVEFRHTSCQCPAVHTPPPHRAELLGAARDCQGHCWSLDCSYCDIQHKSLPSSGG